MPYTHRITSVPCALRLAACLALSCALGGAWALDNNINNNYINNQANNNAINQNGRYSRDQQRQQQEQQKQMEKQKQEAQKLLEKAKELADKAKKEADKAVEDAKKKGKAKGKKKPKPDLEKEVKTETQKIDEDELDHIVMTTNYDIPCKIHKELDDAVIVFVNNEVGRLNIPRTDIRSIIYSMGTRLAALEPDDYLGQYKVGVWAMDKNMYPKVIDLFEKIKDKEGVSTTDILKNLGKAYEQLGQLDKALDAYDEYSKGHPEDKETAELVAALNAQVNPAPKDPAAAAAANAVPKVVDGLEGDGNWTANNWADANPCTLQHYVDKKNGNKMIYVESAGGMKDKSAFTRDGQALNLSDSKEMVFKVFNAGDTPMNLAVAFVNAQNDFHESKQVRINPKTWADQTFKVDANVFKSNRNNFLTYTLDLQGRENITKITLMVYGQRPFKMYVDALFFK